MPAQPPLLSRRRAGLLLLIVTLLACVYMITYSGRIESGDSLHLFDAVSSLVRFGDLLLDETAAQRLPQSFGADASYRLPTVDAEPLPILLAVPLYKLADVLPSLGFVHTVWLFNILICALVCGVFFLYALALGFEERVAVLAALALGLLTIIWPYSKSFFREPLTALLLLLTGLLAERWRGRAERGLGRGLPLLAGLLGALIALLLTKASAVLALPALLLVALPALQAGRTRRVVTVLGVVVAVAVSLFLLLGVYGEALGFGQRYNPIDRILGGSAEYVRRALQAYLMSIGGSVWGTSPLLLLALAGWWIGRRERGLRYLWVGLLMTVSFALGYALLSGNLWFGGLSWPPRFLVPVVPFLMLGTLPVWQRLLTRPFPRLLGAAALVLALYSLWIQFTAVSLPWGLYTTLIPEMSKGLLEWNRGLNYVEHLRWVVLPRAWGSFPFDFAWVRVGIAWWPVVFGGLALFCAAWLWRRLGHLPDFSARFRRLVTLGLPTAATITALVAVSGLYRDDRYLGGLEALWAAQPVLQTEPRPGDLVLLSNRTYEPFFLNYSRLDRGRVVSLPGQPGDQPSPEQPPRVVSDNPNVLLTYETVPFVHDLANSRRRLWLLENGGPDLPWTVRPVERFMAQHYYPLRVIEIDPAVRLIEYDTTDAPDPYAFSSPEYAADLLYGDQLRLTGYALPGGETYAPGDTLPISLYWQAERPPDADVYVAWFLRTPQGGPVAQGMDSRFGGDFAQTGRWTAGQTLWDNRALVIPAETPVGTYRLWIKLYRFDESYAPVDLPVEGAETLDGTVGVLPSVIRVERPEATAVMVR